MSKERFYINGIFWKSLEVRGDDLRRGYVKYHFATKPPPDVAISYDEMPIVDNMATMKKVYFRKSGMGFSLEDKELYFEDGNVYLKEAKDLQPQES